MMHERRYCVNGYYYYAAHRIESAGTAGSVAPAKADSAPSAAERAAVGRPASASDRAARRRALAHKQTNDAIVNRNQNACKTAAGKPAAGCKNSDSLAYMA